MKRILLVCFFATTFFILHAQKPSFGVQAGATFPTFKQKTDEDSKTSKTKVGFTVGVVSDIAINSKFSFQPALNFTQKGGKDEEQDINESEKVTLNYIELPLNFVYNAKSAAGKFFVGAGPSLSFGISGKEKFESNGETEEEKDLFGSDIDQIKAFDFGANFLAGYEFSNGVFLAANYNTGLSNLSNFSDGKFHNRYFGIRLGYMFPAKTKK